MEPSTTAVIADALTRAIAEHRLQPGTKLAEQKLADHFGVSRTLVRQALFQLAQNRLVRLEPARGAFVAAPTVEEARQVFAGAPHARGRDGARFRARGDAGQASGLREHVAQEKAALDDDNATESSCWATSTCAWPS
jgi:DNA-binding GntR family transcriptional regulator